MRKFFKQFIKSFVLLSVLNLVTFAPASSFAQASDEVVSKELTTLFRSARRVISDHQALINDATKGDKGLSPDKVIADALANFQKDMGAAPGSGEAQDALIASVREVMSGAQSSINEQGKGFKGFIPAVFGKGVADKFTAKMNGKMALKLTAPAELIRNRANRPDTWELGVIDSKFKASTWEKGKAFGEVADHSGKSAYRYIIPEYYQESCLNCHGEPKGAKDISGGTKEGAKLGDLGGAVSFVLYK